MLETHLRVTARSRASEPRSNPTIHLRLACNIDRAVEPTPSSRPHRRKNVCEGMWQLQWCSINMPHHTAYVGIAGKHIISKPAAPPFDRAHDRIVLIHHSVGPLGWHSQQPRILSIRPGTGVPASDNVGGRWGSTPHRASLRARLRTVGYG